MPALAWSILLGGGVLLSAALIAVHFVPILSAARRRSLLALALTGFAILPLVTAWAHPEGASLSSVGRGSPTFNAGGKFEDLRDPVKDLSSNPPGGEIAPWMGGIWIAGASLLLLRLGWRLMGVVRLVRSACPDPLLENRLAAMASELGLRRCPRILVSPRVGTPLMWGPPWSVILVPDRMKRLEAPRMRPVLLHEIGHLRRGDAVLQVLVDLLCAVFWFHPLVWMVRGRLLDEQEMACDDDVLDGRIRPSDYAGLLLEVAAARTGRGLLAPPVATLSMTGRSSLGRRVRAVLDPRRRPSRQDRSITTLLLALIVGVSVAVLVLAPLRGFPATIASGRISSPDDLSGTLDGIFATRMEEHRVVGSVIVIVKDGEIFFSRGYGWPTVENDRRVDPGRTIFRIGSISKVFTGVATLQLVDQGALNLDDDVNEHLRSFKLEESFPEPVRVRHLLTHTAGFDQLGTGRHADRREDELSLEAFLKDNLVRVRPPGEVTCYDTYGVTLAGYLVESLSGARFEDVLRTKLFEPLGMTRTGIYLPESLKQDVAVGYDGDHQPQRWEFMNTDPASTINSTAHDMAAFMSMLLNDGVHEGRRILGSASTRAMLTRQFGNHPDLPGYTFLMFEDRDYGIRAVSHGGSMTGYAALMYLLPANRTGIFIALNRESGAFLNEVMGPLVERLIGGGFVDPALEEPTGPSLESFTGVYANNMYNHTRTDSGGWQPDPFYLGIDDQGRLTMGNRSYDRDGPLTFHRDDGLKVAFRQAPDGRVTHMFIRQTTYERLDMAVEDLYGPRLDPAVLSAYSGLYEIEPIGLRVRIYGKEGYLWNQEEGDEHPMRLRHLGDRRFAGSGFELTFRMEGGRASGFDATSPRGELTGKRLPESGG